MNRRTVITRGLGSGLGGVLLMLAGTHARSTMAVQGTDADIPIERAQPAVPNELVTGTVTYDAADDSRAGATRYFLVATALPDGESARSGYEELLAGGIVELNRQGLGELRETSGPVFANGAGWYSGEFATEYSSINVLTAVILSGSAIHQWYAFAPTFDPLDEMIGIADLWFNQRTSGAGIDANRPETILTLLPSLGDMPYGFQQGERHVYVPEANATPVFAESTPVNGSGTDGPSTPSA